MTEKGVEGEGKESPRSEEKVLTMAEISRAVVKGAGRKWGSWRRREFARRKKWGGKFLPPFFKSFSSFVGEFRSQFCGVEIIILLLLLLNQSAYHQQLQFQLDHL